MSEWREFRLDQLMDFRKGINYTSSDYGDESSDCPFITIKCFVKGGGYESTGLKYIRGEFKREDQLQAGDVVFAVTDLTRAGDIVGSPLQVPFYGENVYAVASMDCMRAIPYEAVCDRSFLYYRMMLPDIRGQMVAYSAGSTVLHLDTKQVPRITCLFPEDIPEQKAIANILDTLDTQIRQTEAIIAKLQQVKQGLLHDLLTRGIDANGQLRPPREQAPALYKESTLGWIPREWEAAPIGSRAEISYGISDAIDTALEDGVKTITLPCVKANGDLILSEDALAYTSREKVTSQLMLKKGDLLFNWRNGSQNHLGKTALFDLDGEYTHVGFLLKVRAIEGQCEPTFLYQAIKYAKETGVFLRAKIQVNNTFNSGELRALRLAFPPLHEQIGLSTKLASLEDQISSEHRRINKLKKQKSGLMDDLLTGRVRVNRLLKTA